MQPLLAFYFAFAAAGVKRLVKQAVRSATQCSFYFCLLLSSQGAPVAQWVKCWPTDLADRVQSSLEMKSSQPQTEFHCTSLSLSSKHRPDITEILLKRTSSRKPSTRPFCYYELTPVTSRSRGRSLDQLNYICGSLPL